MLSHNSEVYHACLRTHADDQCFVWVQPPAIARLLGWDVEDAFNAEHELTHEGLIHWRWAAHHHNLRVIHVAPMRPTVPPEAIQ